MKCCLCIRVHSTYPIIHVIESPRTRCACPGENLIFTCTTFGGTRTVWRGTAFNCPNIGNQIILRHTNSSQSFQCNGGSIEGHLLSINGDHYTSQLNVTVVNGINNKTVLCTHTSDTAVSAIIGKATIFVISGRCQNET